MAVMRAADARFLTSGALILAVAMGVGRFAYTPILPAMERDAGLTVSMAGALAVANLFGYLVGASIAMHPITHGRRLAITRWGLAGVVVATALMAETFSPLWLPLRFLTGVGSGLVLVFAASIVLERSAHARQPSWPPLFFSGVGLGIGFSGIAVPVLVARGGSTTAWAGIAIVSAIALIGTGSWFTDDAPAARIAEAQVGAGLPHRGTTFGWLLAAYAAEGFAYVIPATFLVAIIEKVPELSRYAALSWVVVGLAAAFAMFPWIRAAALWGKARCLALALGIQALGVAAPAFSQSAFAIVFSALALGGTFMAITLFAAGIARDVFPHQASAAVSRLTVLYGIGQMCGPILATQLALRFKSYDPALIAAAGVIGIATVITTVYVVERLNHPKERV
jgi:MFS family permease